MRDRFTGPTTPPEPPRYADPKAAFLDAVRLRETARHAAAALHAAGIPVAALKGVALAAYDLPPPGERFSSDVDLLVPRPRLDEAVRALVHAGWTEDLPRPATGNSSQLRDHPQFAPIDLHVDLVGPGRANLPGADVLLRAVDPPRWLSPPLQVSSLPDLFAHLAAHAEYNLVVEARRHHLEDLARVSDRIADVDALLTHVRRTRIGRMLCFLLEFGDIPRGPVLDALQSRLAGTLDPATRALAGTALGTPAHSLPRRLLHVALADRPVRTFAHGVGKRLRG